MNIKFAVILTFIILSIVVFFAVIDTKFFPAGISRLPPSPIGQNSEEISSHKSFIIKMSDNGFFPSDIEISQGETVVFENIDKSPRWPASNIHPSHQVYPEFDPKKGIAPGQKWSFTFQKAGEWRFHDHLYSQFSGSIKVKETIESTEIAKKEEQKLDKPTDTPDIDARLAKVNIMTIAKNDNELRNLLTMAGAKKVMDKLLKDSGGGSTMDCHQESHAVGRIGYEIYGAKVFLDGTAACHSGYFHGAMETLLKEKGTKNLAADISEICNAFPTSFGRFECLHGVGHGVVAYDDYDLPKALETCGKLPSDYEKNSCYGGAFMENVIAAQGLGAVKGHGTNWANKIDPLFPCNKISQDYNIQYQCYQMQTSWMLTMYGYDFSRVAAECQKARPDMISVCFKSYGRDAAGHTLRNSQKIAELCSKVPRETDYYDQCVMGAVNVIIDFWGDGLKYQATDLCKMIEESGKRACYSTIAWRLSDIFSSVDAQREVCNVFESNYKSLCNTS